MEAVMERKFEELAKVKVDYDELFENFQLANKVFEERELAYKIQINDLQESLRLLKRKNDNLKFALSNQNASKTSFTEDVQQLQQAAELLETREAELLAAYDEQSQRYQKCLFDIQVLQQESQTLQAMIQNDMVSLATYTTLGKQFASLEQVLHHDTVSKAQYAQLQDDLRVLKGRLEHDMIDKSTFEALHTKHYGLERRIPLEYVPIEEYQRLQSSYQALLDEKNLLEESSVIVQEIRGQHERGMTEAEAKVVSLKGRVEQTERELQDLRADFDAAHADLASARAELRDTEIERKRLVEANAQLEKLKASLQTQLGNAKMTIRTMQETHQTLLEEKAKASGHLDEARQSFSRSLIESNQKIKEVFDATEDQLRRKVLEQSNKVQHVQQQLDCAVSVNESLQQNLDQSREHVRDLEGLIAEAKSQLQLQLAFNENNVRENTDLRSQIMGLREEREQLIGSLQQVQMANKQLTDQLDEFKVLVFAELSPGFKTFLSNNTHPHFTPAGLTASGSSMAGRKESPLSSASASASASSSVSVAAKRSSGNNTDHLAMIHVEVPTARALQPPERFLGKTMGSSSGNLSTMTTTELLRPMTPATNTQTSSLHQVGSSGGGSHSRPATPVSAPMLSGNKGSKQQVTDRNQQQQSPEEAINGTIRLLSKLDDEILSQRSRKSQARNNPSPPMDLTMPAVRPVAQRPMFMSPSNDLHGHPIVNDYATKIDAGEL